MDTKEKRDILHKLLEIKINLLPTGIKIEPIDRLMIDLTNSICCPARGLPKDEFDL